MAKVGQVVRTRWFLRLTVVPFENSGASNGLRDSRLRGSVALPSSRHTGSACHSCPRALRLLEWSQADLLNIHDRVLGFFFHVHANLGQTLETLDRS